MAQGGYDTLQAKTRGRTGIKPNVSFRALDLATNMKGKHKVLIVFYGMYFLLGLIEFLIRVLVYEVKLFTC